MSKLDSVIAHYCAAAQGTSLCADVAKANKFASEVHAGYMSLRQSQAGRDAIVTLMSHTDANVQLWAARHCLEWTPHTAQPGLRKMGVRLGGGFILVLFLEWRMLAGVELGR